VTDSLWRALRNIATLAALCAQLVVGGCNRSGPSRTRIELRDVDSAKSRSQISQQADFPPCPPGDPVDNAASSSPAGGHVVNLSWKASSSSDGPHPKKIAYCLYRSVGHPVQPSGLRVAGKAPCVKCQRVTLLPVSRTTYRDTQVENGVHYCYVALAMESGNVVLSSFSNQADAIVPPKKEPSFCNAPPTTARAKKKRQRRHH